MITKLTSYKKGIIIGTIIFSMFLIFQVTLIKYGYYYFHNTQNVQDKKILNKLHDINDSLALMKNSSLMQQQKILSELEKDLTAIQKSNVDSVKLSDIQNISSQITSIKEDVNLKITDIKKMISDTLGNKEYLDAGLLPFKVVSIDVISGQTYITIEYANHIFPLSIGDIIAGWHLNHADYELNNVEFINDKNQSIKLHIEGI